MSNILKYQNPSSPLLDPEKIIRNVPAREWGPRKMNEDYTITEGKGTNFWKAPFQYWGNKGFGLQNEKLARDLIEEFDQMRSENPDYDYTMDKNYPAYDDAINYINHLEGLKKYLGLPYDTGLLMENQYKPTRLQGTNEKTYKFRTTLTPGYWDDVVEDMVIGEHNKNQYYDQSLNEFTAYRDRDEKGDFVSIYDEWDYNPAVRGGNKKLNKVVDSVTGGKPFVIYDRVYLDDYYDIPEDAKGNPFITPAVVTAHKKGGRIHIKKKNRGKFTEYCGGKVTQECIAKGKKSKDPKIRKRATFASNSRRWKHENGGILKAQEGTGNLYAPHPLSPVGIALNQAKAMTKMKGEQHLPPGVKEVVGPDGKKVAIRTEQPLVPLEQSIAEWLPGTGDVAEVGYIANDVKNGNLGSAALAAAMVALPGNVGKVFRKSDVPASKLTEAEKLGIPKGERNQPLNGHLKGDDAVQMFKEYGTTTIPSNSKIYSQIQQLVPEARERYKLVGRTDITDDEIAGSLYKRAMELSGNSNAAIWETGEPRLLFRGDTRRYNRLMDKWSPEKLAKGKGTMDNSLGNLFLGDISGKGQGVDRYFISGTDFFEPRIQGSATGARGKLGTIIDGGGEGIQGTTIPYIPKDAYKLSTYQTYAGPYSLYKFPGKYSESGISDLNAFITRTPAMRDATGEISVLADDFIMKTKNYKGPNIDDYDGPTYDGVNSTVRDAMAKHYQSVLDDAQSKGQGLLFSEGLTDEYIKKFGEIHPFRREHERYDYYALPNFNRQNAKHLFGWDLRRPIQWDIDNIYLEKGGKL